jgi:hypothetical protein
VTFKGVNTTASDEEIELIKLHGIPFIMSEDGYEVRGYHYLGSMYIESINRLDETPWEMLDRFFGYLQNFLALVGVVAFCVAIGLFSGGFFDYYASKFPDSLIGSLFGG